MLKLLRISTLTALALGAMALTAQAQQKTFGLVAGANFATINSDVLSDGLGTRTGFVGGLFVGIPVGGGNWMIEPEVLYSMQGATYDNTEFDGTYAADYVKIPLLVKWVANPGGKGLYVMLGPSISINVSCNDSGTDKSDNSDYDGTCEDENGYTAKSTVFSGDVGLGYSTGRFGIEGRYSWDWGDAWETQGDPLIPDGTSLDAKNSVISVLLRFTK